MISLVNDDKVYTVSEAEAKYYNHRILMYDMDISDLTLITGKVYAVGDKNSDVNELYDLANKLHRKNTNCITLVAGYCDEGGFVGVQYITRP